MYSYLFNFLHEETIPNNDLTENEKNYFNLDIRNVFIFQ